MTIETTRFGAVDVPDQQCITIQGGLLGFEGQEQFCLLEHGPQSPFLWLQAVDKPELAFVAVNPFDFVADYDIVIDDAEAARLALQTPEQALVLTLVTVRDDAVTTNLLGPIVINREQRCARQLVLNNSAYSTRHPLLPTQ